MRGGKFMGTQWTPSGSATYKLNVSRYHTEIATCLHVHADDWVMTVTIITMPHIDVAACIIYQTATCESLNNLL